MNSSACDMDRTVFAADLAEMMRVWDEIMAAVERQWPTLTPKEAYNVAVVIMNKSLGL